MADLWTKNFDSHDEYRKFMYKGGIFTSNLDVPNLENEPLVLREHYSKLVTSKTWRTSGNVFIVGGIKAREFVYNSVALVRMRNNSDAHALPITGMYSVADVRAGRSYVRCPVGPFSYKSGIQDVIDSKGLVGILDYELTTLPEKFEGQHGVTRSDRRLIDDWLLFRGVMKYPTIIHCPYSPSELKEVISGTMVNFFENNYKIIKQADIYE